MEIVHLVPDDRFLESGFLVGYLILGNVLEEFVEDIIERKVVYEFGRILFIEVRNVVHHFVRYVFQRFAILPNLFEGLKEIFRRFVIIELDDVPDDGIVIFETESGAAEFVDSLIRVLFAAVIQDELRLDEAVGSVGLESDLRFDPFTAFFRYGASLQFVFQIDFKFRAGDGLSYVVRVNLEHFLLFLARFIFNECRIGKNEP